MAAIKQTFYVYCFDTNAYNISSASGGTNRGDYPLIGATIYYSGYTSTATTAGTPVVTGNAALPSNSYSGFTQIEGRNIGSIRIMARKDGWFDNVVTTTGLASTTAYSAKTYICMYRYDNKTFLLNVSQDAMAVGTNGGVMVGANVSASTVLSVLSGSTALTLGGFSCSFSPALSTSNKSKIVSGITYQSSSTQATFTLGLVSGFTFLVSNPSYNINMSISGSSGTSSYTFSTVFVVSANKSGYQTSLTYLTANADYIKVSGNTLTPNALTCTARINSTVISANSGTTDNTFIGVRWISGATNVMGRPNKSNSFEYDWSTGLTSIQPCARYITFFLMSGATIWAKKVIPIVCNGPGVARMASLKMLRDIAYAGALSYGNSAFTTQVDTNLNGNTGVIQTLKANGISGATQNYCPVLKDYLITHEWFTGGTQEGGPGFYNAITLRLLLDSESTINRLLYVQNPKMKTSYDNMGISIGKLFVPTESTGDYYVYYPLTFCRRYPSGNNGDNNSVTMSLTSNLFGGKFFTATVPSLTTTTLWSGFSMNFQFLASNSEVPSGLTVTMEQNSKNIWIHVWKSKTLTGALASSPVSSSTYYYFGRSDVSSYSGPASKIITPDLNYPYIIFATTNNTSNVTVPELVT